MRPTWQTQLCTVSFGSTAGRGCHKSHGIAPNSEQSPCYVQRTTPTHLSEPLSPPFLPIPQGPTAAQNTPQNPAPWGAGCRHGPGPTEGAEVAPCRGSARVRRSTFLRAPGVAPSIFYVPGRGLAAVPNPIIGLCVSGHRPGLEGAAGRSPRAVDVCRHDHHREPSYRQCTSTG